MPRSHANTSRRRSLSLAWLLGVGIAVAACSGSSASAAPTTGSTAPGVTAAPVDSAAAGASTGAGASGGAGACTGAGTVFCGHVKISGGVTEESDFVSSVFSLGCVDWLKGKRDDPTMLTLPIALVGDINTDTVIQHYKGPGTYDVADLAGNLGGFEVAVGTDRFITDAKTTGTATLAADGSGSVTSKGMVPAGDGNKVQQPIDLSLTWTCYTK